MSKRLHELFEEFISESQYVHLKRPDTIKGYRYCFDLFTKLVPGVSLQLLTPQTLTSFFKILQERNRIVGKGEVRCGVKKSTIASYWNKLSAFFTWLTRKKYIASNPLSEMHCPVPTYEDRKFLPREHVEKILAALHNQNAGTLIFKRNLVIVYLLLFCGLRREELLGLQLRDIDFDKTVLTIRAETSKSGKSRQIPLHSVLVLQLKEYLAERKSYSTPYLIVSSQGDDCLSYDGLDHVVDRLKQLSGVKFHLHQFRHTFAVNFLKTSRDLSKLKQLLGHSDIKMTAIYLRNLPVDEMQKDVEKMNVSSLI